METVIVRRRRFIIVALLMVIGGIATIGVRSQPAGAVVGAYVELHVAECPPDHDNSSLFDDCHENRVPGISFAAEGSGEERYEGITDADGIVMFNDFYTAGAVTVMEVGQGGDHGGYEMYCSTIDDQIELPVEERGDGRAAATFELPQSVIDAGSGVVCDWYYFAPAAADAQLSTSPVAAEAPSSGLGLTRTEWEEIHGSGTPTQHVVMYEDGQYAVGYSAGIVTFIETDWLAGGGIPAIDAADEVAELIPPDSVLVQRYSIPRTPSTPVGLIVERYESETLSTRLADQPLLWDGSLIVLYLEAVRDDSTDPLAGPPILRVSIAAGSDATGT